MHFCLYWYRPCIHEKVFKKYLDIQSQGKSDKNGIFDVMTSCSIFDKICINICQVLRKLFEHVAKRQSVQNLPRDPVSVNAMKQTSVIVI